LALARQPPEACGVQRPAGDRRTLGLDQRLAEGDLEVAVLLLLLQRTVSGIASLPPADDPVLERDRGGLSLANSRRPAGRLIEHDPVAAAAKSRDVETHARALSGG
jgi:hypothetical protein